MSCCLRITPPLAPPPRVVVEVLEEAWAISSNLGNWGMAAEDGPCLSSRSVPLRSMFDPSRHRRWPHRGGSLLLANPPQSALIYSPELGVFDVAGVCFSLRRGPVISSGVLDMVDVADADLEVNARRVTFAQ